MEVESAARSRGRPRAFDRDQALEAALAVFWNRGFEGATLEELTGAMGINRPSLYAAFGDKEALFRAALDRYRERASAYAARALACPTAREAVAALVEGSIRFTTPPGGPRGCLMVSGGLTGSPESAPVRQLLREHRNRNDRALLARLRRARDEGELPPEADPKLIARVVATLLRGLAVQATGGVGRAELRRVARATLRGWPFSP
jgi:AcrR family transcriptional regulator